MYQYSPDAPKRDLVITVPRIPDAYLTCRGVQKDNFTRGDVKIETSRYGAQFVLKGENDYHVAMYKTFEKVITRA